MASWDFASQRKNYAQKMQDVQVTKSLPQFTKLCIPEKKLCAKDAGCAGNKITAKVYK